MKKTFYIKTYGCQMNFLDSQLVAGLLTQEGYQPTGDPSRAAVILVNTCAVREHAEQRALGRIRELLRHKRGSPVVKLVVMGCMAQRLGEELFRLAPGVDMVVGPDSYRKLPRLLEGLDHTPISSLALNPKESYSEVAALRGKGISAFVSVMRGCNNFCSFCIVPLVRGRERSRPPEEIVMEVKGLVAQGFKEVTLLGQNVNSYRWGETDFPSLLLMLNGIEGLGRIRFTTSHPKDLSPQLLEVIGGSNRVCEHLHLPLQSGSNRILQRMNRGYTREGYLKLIEDARRGIPNLALTTDLIAGFPGEDDDDFQQTVEVMKEVSFDSSFTFKYSSRPGTKAAGFTDDVPPEVKAERLTALIELQRRITAELNQALVGTTQEVLVEKVGKLPGQLFGRTRTNKPVVSPGEEGLMGHALQLRIIKAKGWTLFGEPSNQATSSRGSTFRNQGRPLPTDNYLVAGP